MKRLFPILFILLTLATMTAGMWMWMNLRTPRQLSFEEALFSAEIAVKVNKRLIAGWELNRASRHASSVYQWKEILKLRARLIPEEYTQPDFRPFARLAARAVSTMPGNQDLIAYHAWARLRSGSLKKAQLAVDSLHAKRWVSLKAEINTAVYLNEKKQSLDDFILRLESQTDAEFFEEAAALTQSAELTMDAALAYMGIGQASKALGLSLEIMSGKRWWQNPENLHRRGLLSALGRIAYDAGDIEKTIEWMEQGLAEGRERRMVIWEDLQFLGDVYWKSAMMQGRLDYLPKARELWQEALAIAQSEQGAWKIWIGLSALEEAAGNHRLSEKILRDALALFPDQSEVKAAWARKHRHDNPNLAGRLVQNNGDDPVLAIASLQIDPAGIPPRLYEMKLWELFEGINSEDADVLYTDSRYITTFLLEYMTAQNNYSSIDIVVDRYRKIYPDESWILAWSLAADSSRHVAIIDLIPMQPTALAPYDEYRKYVHEMMSWRGLHDSALFAVMAVQELESLIEGIPETPTSVDIGFHDSFLINKLNEISEIQNLMNAPFGDRVRILVENRDDTMKFRKLLESLRPKASESRAIAKAVMIQKTQTLLANGQKDLQVALNMSNLSGRDKARLLYLKAYILRYLGQADELRRVIGLALEADPNNLRILELSSSVADQ